MRSNSRTFYAVELRRLLGECRIRSRVLVVGVWRTGPRHRLTLAKALLEGGRVGRWHCPR